MGEAWDDAELRADCGRVRRRGSVYQISRQVAFFAAKCSGCSGRKRATKVRQPMTGWHSPAIIPSDSWQVIPTRREVRMFEPSRET